MWIEEIKNMATNEQWKVIKNAIPEVQHYADKTGYSKRAGAELVRAGYQRHRRCRQNNSRPSLMRFDIF